MGHSLAVEHGKLLSQLHVVDIVRKQLSFHIGQIPGDRQLLLLAQGGDGLLDLLKPSLGF